MRNLIVGWLIGTIFLILGLLTYLAIHGGN